MSYPFDPSFERAVIGLLVTSDRFFNLIGPHLDPTEFKDERAQELAAASRRIYDRVAKAPGSLAVVLQELRVKNEQGKLLQRQMEACADYVCDALDEGLPDADVAIDSVAAVLKRIKESAVLDKAFTVHGKRGDMTEVARELESVQSIGISDASYGSTLDDFAEELERSGQAERLPTGFKELDAETQGGPARGEFVFWLAGEKVGKSMALVQNAAIGMLRTLHVAVATLELDEEKWRARVLGTITGTPYQDILRYKSKSIAFARYRAMQEDPTTAFGRFAVHKFGGHQTTVDTVFDWVRREEDRAGSKVDLLVVDYADKLLGPDPSQSQYEQMKHVYERLRLFGADGGRWVWTASQATRIPLGEMPTNTHCADSHHKVRVTDGMIGITRLPADENKVRAKILAWRNGPGDSAEAGPLPNGFNYGCFVKSAAVGVEVEESLAGADDDA